MSKTDGREAFLKALEDLNWATIDQLREKLDGIGYWTDEDREAMVTRGQNADVRRLIRQFRDDENWPIFASIRILDPQGRPMRMYKQELLFEADDYRQVVRYWSDRTGYSYHMATGYRDRGNRRFVLNLELPLDFLTEGPTEDPDAPA